MMDCSVAVGSLSGLFFVSTSIKPSPSLSGFRSGRLVALVQTARRPAAKRSLAAGDKRDALIWALAILALCIMEHF